MSTEFRNSAFANGRVSGVRSSDNGKTWQQFDMPAWQAAIHTAFTLSTGTAEAIWREQDAVPGLDASEAEWDFAVLYGSSPEARERMLSIALDAIKPADLMADWGLTCARSMALIGELRNA